MTRILHGFALLCKLGLLFIKAHLDYQIYKYVNMIGETKRILAVVVKWNHFANGLLQIIHLFAMFMFSVPVCLQDRIVNSCYFVNFEKF